MGFGRSCAALKRYRPRRRPPTRGVNDDPACRNPDQTLVSLLSIGAMTVLLTAFVHPAKATCPRRRPAGRTVFSDDFNGPAGSGVERRNWMYNTGPGSNFGTGEIETMTNSTNNVYLDGNGDLELSALGSGNNWTSGRIQTPSSRRRAGGRQVEVRRRSSSPTRQRPRLLAGVLDARPGRSGRRTARSTSWRTSTRGPRSPAPSTAASSPAARATRATASAAGCAPAVAARPASTPTR